MLPPSSVAPPREKSECSCPLPAYVCRRTPTRRTSDRKGRFNRSAGQRSLLTRLSFEYLDPTGFSDESQGNDVHLWRVDAEGELLWETQIGGDRDERAMMGVVRSDESFAVVGYADGNGDVLHVTSSGELLATRTFEHPGFDRGVMIRETRDGGFVMTGAWAAPDTEHSDLRLIFFSRW